MTPTPTEQKAALEKAWYAYRERLEEAARDAAAVFLTTGKSSENSFAGGRLEHAAREFIEAENKLRELLGKAP